MIAILKAETTTEVADAFLETPRNNWGVEVYGPDVRIPIHPDDLQNDTFVLPASVCEE